MTKLTGQFNTRLSEEVLTRIENIKKLPDVTNEIIVIHGLERLEDEFEMGEDVGGRE